MIATGRYYVMYNDIKYIDEHVIKTHEVNRIETGWTEDQFVNRNTGYLGLLSMAIDINYIYVLYEVRSSTGTGYFINRYTLTFGFVDKTEILNVKPTSIASNLTNTYIAYRDSSKQRRVAQLGVNLQPNVGFSCNITHIFGYEGVLYGFDRGTITGALYQIDVNTSALMKILNNAQKNGPDYGAHRTKFYGFSSPGYLEYNIKTGLPIELQFTPKYANYTLAALSTSDGIVTYSEEINFGESMFMVQVGKYTYPASDTGALAEEEGFVTYENYAPNINLYTGR